MDTKDKAHLKISLKYGKGDLIMKEGDYGVSIYKVNKGHVRVSQQQGEMDVALASLGPGEIFGEMAFLNKAVETRSASVRAMDDVELEVMHPKILSSEYEGMPPILRYITNQTLNRLARMNKMYTQLLKKTELTKARDLREPETNKRQYYRKPLHQACVYRPVRGSGKVRLEGQITDISVGGVGMDVSAGNTLKIPHEPGDEFAIHTTLPNGREVDLVGKIRGVAKTSTPGRLKLGMQFTGLNGESSKTLGFFMMS
ncbi:MAG: cyclic nucleotide-binding domain-containing protein [Thermodesulfobacteriota bacterium]